MAHDRLHQILVILSRPSTHSLPRQRLRPRRCITSVHRGTLLQQNCCCAHRRPKNLWRRPSIIQSSQSLITGGHHLRRICLCKRFVNGPNILSYLPFTLSSETLAPHGSVHRTGIAPGVLGRAAFLLVVTNQEKLSSSIVRQRTVKEGLKGTL